MTLKELKSKATISELAFINVIESAVRKEEDTLADAERLFTIARQCIEPLVTNFVMSLGEIGGRTMYGLRETAARIVREAEADFYKRCERPIPETPQP